MSDRTCASCSHRPVCRLWATVARAVVDVSYGIPVGDLQPDVQAAVAKHCPHFEERPSE